jgi:mannose-6-phosphate isomerase
MVTKPSVYPLKGKVQHYAWGGYDFIPQLLGESNSSQQPYAEYWLGAHPSHSATIELGEQALPLVQLIKEQPALVLGQKVEQQFGPLPYLLKVLDVKQMLSIQVHPDKASAEVAFEAENNAGVAITAFNRNYKDTNHKPELMVALSDFWLLHGFKPEDRLQEVLSSEPDFDFLLEEFEQKGYEGLYKKVMTMDQQEVNAVLKPVVSRILPLYRNGELQKKHEDFWAARAVETFCKGDDYDRGIFSIYFFNLLHLQKGEGIYQPAGLPHAYLEGQNVEIMANSDNVLRAGLTDKHIDITELMKHVRFEATNPHILRARTNEVETVYKSPAAEFELSRYQLKKGVAQQWQTDGPEILLLLNGRLEITTDDTRLSLQKGEAAFAIAGAAIACIPLEESIVFRAAVPTGGKN